MMSPVFMEGGDHGHRIMVCCDSSPISGNRHLPRAGSWILFREVHIPRHWPGIGHSYLALRRHHWTDWHHHFAAPQGICFSHVSVRRGLWVRPQFVRGIAKDGVPQAVFAAIQCVFCLAVPVVIAKIAGYDFGYAAGLYSGSQTISAAMGLSTDAINRLGLPADQVKGLLDSMPIAYAVTYMFGTVGSAIVIAVVGPALLRMDVAAAC